MIMNKKLIIGIVAGVLSAAVATTLGIVGAKHVANHRTAEDVVATVVE